MKLLKVPYISQKGIWPTGCESVSTVMLLQYLGFSIDVADFVDRYLIKREFETRDGVLYGGDPRRIFCGDPRREDGFGCYADVILDTLDRIFADSSLTRNDPENDGDRFFAVDETGTPTEELLRKYIDRGMPVIYWACINMLPPYEGPSWKLFDSQEEFVWRSNEHCLLLVGYDEDSYIFNDPYDGNGVIHYPRQLVEARHEAQYAMAVGVRREKPALQRLNRERVFAGGIVDLYKDTVCLPDGNVQEWDYVHHKKGSGACVVPVLPDGRILMIRQYRPAVDEVVLELPAGGKDPGEDSADTALRELREETGYTCEEAKFLLRLRTAPAYCNEFTDIYLCENIRRIGEQTPDEAEEITLYPYSLHILLEMIRRGELSDGKSAAGILAYDSLRHGY